MCAFYPKQLSDENDALHFDISWDGWAVVHVDKGPRFSTRGVKSGSKLVHVFVECPQ